MADDAYTLKVRALELANTHAAEPAKIVERANAYHAFLSGAAATPKATAQTGTKTATTTDADKAKAAAEAKAKADAAAKAKAEAEAKAKAAAASKAGPAAGTKAPGGKHTIDEVRDMIRKVATSESLGKQSAADILNDDGGGVSKVTDLKPEFYDAVYEACQVMLNGEGGAAGSAEDDLM